MPSSKWSGIRPSSVLSCKTKSPLAPAEGKMLEAGKLQKIFFRILAAFLDYPMRMHSTPSGICCSATDTS